MQTRTEVCSGYKAGCSGALIHHRSKWATLLSGTLFPLELGLRLTSHPLHLSSSSSSSSDSSSFSLLLQLHHITEAPNQPTEPPPLSPNVDQLKACRASAHFVSKPVCNLFTHCSVLIGKIDQSVKDIIIRLIILQLYCTFYSYTYSSHSP